MARIPYWMSGALAFFAACDSATEQRASLSPREKERAARVHHILVEVKSIDRSLKFYRDELGFILTSRSGDFAQLTGATVDLYLWEKRWDWEAPRRKEERQGLGMYSHVVVEDVDVFAARLKKAGYVVIQEPRHYSTFREAFVADPDGYTWALISHITRE